MTRQVPFLSLCSGQEACVAGSIEASYFADNTVKLDLNLAYVEYEY
jgi:hypothetical protein